MSLIFADSLTRYGNSDGVSAAPFLLRYGWSASGNVHNKTGSHFGASHLQISGGSQGGKSAYWAAIRRSITPTTSVGMSLKCSPFSFQDAGTGTVTDYHFARITLSNGHYVDLFIGLQIFHNNSFTTNSVWTTNVHAMYFRYNESVDIRNSAANAALPGRRIDFSGKTMNVYSRPASRDVMWTANFTTTNWMHLDFSFNTVTKRFSARAVFPQDNTVFSALTTDPSPRVVIGNVITIPDGLTITAVTVYGTDWGGTKVSDLVLWTEDSVGLSSMPDSPLNLRVQRVVPASDGSFNTWTPTSGTNTAMVSETPYSDATLSTGVGIGSKQTFLMGALGSSTSSIKSGVRGIQINPNLMDVGANNSVAAPIQVIGGTETSLGSGVVPSRVSYTAQARMLTINPQTSLPYTVAEINAMELGLNIQ